MSNATGPDVPLEIERKYLLSSMPEVPAEARLLERGRPTIEAQLVDHADSIAYVHHDLDDGLRAGILDEDELVREVELWREASASLGTMPDARLRQQRHASHDARLHEVVHQRLSGVLPPEVDVVDQLLGAAGLGLARRREHHRRAVLPEHGVDGGPGRVVADSLYRTQGSCLSQQEKRRLS